MTSEHFWKLSAVEKLSLLHVEKAEEGRMKGEHEFNFFQIETLKAVAAATKNIAITTKKKLAAFIQV